MPIKWRTYAEIKKEMDEQEKLRNSPFTEDIREREDEDAKFLRESRERRKLNEFNELLQKYNIYYNEFNFAVDFYFVLERIQKNKVSYNISILEIRDFLRNDYRYKKITSEIILTIIDNNHYLKLRVKDLIKRKDEDWKGLQDYDNYYLNSNKLFKSYDIIIINKEDVDNLIENGQKVKLHDREYFKKLLK